MAEALFGACQGDARVCWHYYHEPRATEAVLEHGENGWTLTLFEVDDFNLMPTRPTARRRLLGKSPVLVRDLVADVITAAGRMRQELEARETNWSHPVPERYIAELKRFRVEGRLPD